MSVTDVCKCQDRLTSRVQNIPQHMRHSDVRWCRPCIDTDPWHDYMKNHYSSGRVAHSYMLHTHTHIHARTHTSSCCKQLLYCTSHCVTDYFTHSLLDNYCWIYFWRGLNIPSSSLSLTYPLVFPILSLFGPGRVFRDLQRLFFLLLFLFWVLLPVFEKCLRLC